MEAPVRRKKSELRLVLWVVGALFFGILVWGTSMYLLRRNIGGTVMLLIRERERVKGLESWVRWAEEERITYDAAVRRGKKVFRRPVIWEIHIPDPAANIAYYMGDPSRQVDWLHPDKVKPSGGHGKDGKTYRIVGAIRGVVPGAKVIGRGRKTVTEQPARVTLEYLGYQ